MLDLSVHAANQLYGASNAVLILGAVLVLIGTIGVVWTNGIRERYADERISHNEAQTATANAQAAKASERAAELTRQAAALQVDLERERIERLKIEERIAPRRLTDRQRELLQVSLAKIPRPLRIEFTRLGDKEAAAYANDILAVLEKIGAVGELSDVGVMAPPVYGILLTLNPNNTKARAIKLAFDEAGVEVSFTTGEIPSADIRIVVGLKPPR